MMQKIRHDAAFGSNIRRIRMKNHFTQEQVVAQMQLSGCSISRETYAKIESGIANIRVKELVVLREIFHTDFGDFFAGIESNDSESSDG